jgi:hypothetical protein
MELQDYSEKKLIHFAFPKNLRAPESEYNICKLAALVSSRYHTQSSLMCSFTPLQTVYDYIYEYSSRDLDAFITNTLTLKNHIFTNIHCGRYGSARTHKKLFRFGSHCIFNTSMYINNRVERFVAGIVIPDINHVKRLVFEVIIYGEIIDYSGVFWYNPINKTLTKEIKQFIKDYDIPELNPNNYIVVAGPESEMANCDLDSQIIDEISSKFKESCLPF